MPKKKEDEKTPNIVWKTALQYMQERQSIKKIPTGTPLDSLIGGGIEEQEVIELAGEYGSGKTQLCYTVICNIKQPTVWIDTENTFRPERLAEIAQTRGLDPQEIQNLVHLTQPLTTEEQLETLKHLKKKNPKIIIVDSLVTLYREEYIGRETLPPRQGALRTFIVNLKKYVRENNCIGILTNQVIANPNLPTPFMPIEQQLLAVGGHTVYHAVDNRFLIRKASAGKRIARLIDSSMYPPAEVTFRITEKGVEAIEEKKEGE
jgi:DNA repair protein RadA